MRSSPRRGPHLTATRFPLEKRRLVWVSDSRAYYSSTESRELPREGHEATAYASVYKFSHDVSPGRAALGSGGCTDCHRTGSPFFQGAVLAEAFSGNDARPRWVPNHDILGISSFWVKVGAFREERLKPVLYSLGGVPALLGLLLGLRSLAVRQGALTARVATGAAWSLLVAAIIGGLLAVSTPGLLDFMVGRRLTLDANHFWIGIAVLTAALLTSLMRPPAEAPVPRIGRFLARRLGPFFLGLSALAGALIVLKMRWLESVTRLSYTAFDLGLVLLASSAVVLLALRLAAVGEVGSHKAPE